jgi:glycosyltransferase involved in cell wall biosynthesis
MAAPVSVVVTVRNDRDGLADLLPALAAQRLAPAEIVIVDAGSADGSAELIAYWTARGLPIRTLDAPDAGISAGRNLGVAAARHDRVAVTDAGCRPEPGWLEALARGLERNAFVAGVYEVEPATPFEHAVAVALYPDVDELREPTAFAGAWQRLFGRRFEAARATGRSMAFTRAAWEAAGGFPETVDAGEDVTFSAALVAAGSHELAPDAVVTWRGRRTWRANLRMYWRYAEGEAILGAQPRALVRGLAWVLAAALLARGPLARVAVAAGAGAYVSLPLARARRRGLSPWHWWRIPALIALKDVAMLAGTIAGIAESRLGVTLKGSTRRS